MLFLNIICLIWLVVSIVNIVESFVLIIETSHSLKAMGYRRKTKRTFFEKVINWISLIIKASIPLWHLFLLIGLLFMRDATKAKIIEQAENDPEFEKIN